MSYKLIHGDCLEVMPTLADKSIDAVITDPPYGIDFKSNGQLFTGAKSIYGDKTTELAEIVAKFYSGKTVMMFFSPYKPYNINWRNVLVWNKGGHVGIGGDRETCWKRDFELIGVKDNRPLNGFRDSAVLNFNAVLPPPSGHFAEKPVGLMAYLIRKLTNPGDTIIDPFMGSGSTIVAAIQEGRNAIGIERDADYFAIAQQRCLEATYQPSLFTPQPTQWKPVAMFGDD